MKVAAAILAGGSGTRFGADKTVAMLGGRQVWEWSFDAFRAHPLVSEVILVTGQASKQEPPFPSVKVVAGGSTRLASSKAALDACAEDVEILLVHDAARPFIFSEMITRVIEATKEFGAAAPVMPVTDTIRMTGPSPRLIDRDKLVAMQTPQAARIGQLKFAHGQARGDETDEMALIEAIGAEWKAVPGDERTFKITTKQDLARAEGLLRSETRTGLGYDVHRFAEDASRELWLGGIRFPEGPGLLGHSDADVVLHASVDALLGAAAYGDIGQHFPPSDPQWEGAGSSHFLAHAASLLRGEDWEIVNLDIAVIAEVPKIMPRSAEIREKIAGILGIAISRVSIKATTNEGLGSIGRSEGIAAFATATIHRFNATVGD